MVRTGQRGSDDELATQLALARQAETQAHELAHDVRTLTQWLRHDVLTLAGPALATRQALFDFLVEELILREPAWFRIQHFWVTRRAKTAGCRNLISVQGCPVR